MASDITDNHSSAATPAEDATPTKPKGEHHCNFCGKNQDDVRIVLKGNDACICDECIPTAFRVAVDNRPEDLMKQFVHALFDDIQKATGSQPYVSPAAMLGYLEEALTAYPGLAETLAKEQIKPLSLMTAAIERHAEGLLEDFKIRSGPEALALITRLLSP